MSRCTFLFSLLCLVLAELDVHFSFQFFSSLCAIFTLLVVQESDRLLSGERGHGRLRNLQKVLRARQQYMISQVSFLYPVKTLIGATEELELDFFPGSSRPGIWR